MPTEHCIFKYLYRDAGNWKTWGAVLLRGTKHEAQTAAEFLREGENFVAEQLGVASLCSEHFNRYGGPTELDHAYHEFHSFLVASPAEISSMPERGSINEFVARLSEIDGRWDVERSPNAWL